jgi:hypothetical protein
LFSFQPCIVLFSRQGAGKGRTFWLDEILIVPEHCLSQHALRLYAAAWAIDGLNLAFEELVGRLLASFTAGPACLVRHFCEILSSVIGAPNTATAEATLSVPSIHTQEQEAGSASSIASAQERHLFTASSAVPVLCTARNAVSNSALHLAPSSWTHTRADGGRVPHQARIRACLTAGILRVPSHYGSQTPVCSRPAATAGSAAPETSLLDLRAFAGRRQCLVAFSVRNFATQQPQQLSTTSRGGRCAMAMNLHRRPRSQWPLLGGELGLSWCNSGRSCRACAKSYNIASSTIYEHLLFLLRFVSQRAAVHGDAGRQERRHQPRSRSGRVVAMVPQVI